MIARTRNLHLSPGAGAVVLGLALLFGGCGREVTVTTIDPEEGAREALAEYDTNKDGFLDATELRRCPALAADLKSIDKNGDGKLSAEEIETRLAQIKNSKIGLVRVPCTVTLDRQPLEGATVTFVPEKFMGPSVKPASGVSDAGGAVVLQVAGQPVPGVECGYFQVTVSKKAGEREILPARYNTQTILGQPVPPDIRGGIKLVLDSNP